MLEKTQDVVVLGLFPGLTTESAEYQIYEETTNEHRELYICSHAFDAALANKHFKVSKPSVLVLYPHLYVAKGEPKFRVLEINAETSISDINTFISANIRPLVGDYECTNCEKLYDAVDTVRIYTAKDQNKAEDKNTKYWHARAAAVARKFSGKGLHFVICDESRQSADMAAMKLTDLGVETVFGIKTAAGDKFSPASDVLDDMDDFAETLEEFVADFLAGKLKVRRKSGLAPKKQGPVHVVVGDTFNEVVLNKKKDVLVEFYAPWCGHCKSLEPKYLQLAKDLKHEKNLIIAKMDTTANEYPSEFTVKGYPTIYLAPAGGKELVPYEGEREVDDLKKFIKEHAAISMGNSIIKDEL